MKLHHVRVGCPAGGEQAARAFYAGVLGLTEVAKPPALAFVAGHRPRPHAEWAHMWGPPVPRPYIWAHSTAGGQRRVTRPGLGSRPDSPFQARLHRWAATMSLAGLRVSSHHWPVVLTMPTSICAYRGE